ncbi:MAG: polymer-forming cytoskeletal protein [Acidobacteria bacterium]|nr:polymer-forming cytoskeletal protein [Acidobacteriota bacterium]MBS1865726.1 polymer-forming cytoskeletal protein [Acidobacteriota bacterium]
MWKKEDAKPQGVTEISTAPVGTANVGSSNLNTPGNAQVSSNAAACISQGIRIKGEVSGKEDLFIDGILEGKLEMGAASVTIGPNGKVKADIAAREIVVRGSVTGKLAGRDRVQLWNTGSVVGEVQTERLAIEDGAVLRGKIEAGKPRGNRSDIGKSAAVGGESPKAGSVAAGTAI